MSPEEERRQKRREEEMLWMLEQVLLRIKAHRDGSNPLPGITPVGWTARPVGGAHRPRAQSPCRHTSSQRQTGS